MDQVVCNSLDIVASGIFDDFLNLISIIHPIPVNLFLAFNRLVRDKGFEVHFLVGLLCDTQFVLNVLDIKEDREFMTTFALESGR